MCVQSVLNLNTDTYTGKMSLMYVDCFLHLKSVILITNSNLHLQLLFAFTNRNLRILDSDFIARCEPYYIELHLNFGYHSPKCPFHKPLLLQGFTCYRENVVPNVLMTLHLY